MNVKAHNGLWAKQTDWIKTQLAFIPYVGIYGHCIQVDNQLNFLVLVVVW